MTANGRTWHGLYTTILAMNSDLLSANGEASIGEDTIQLA
jgi:hypothetical protein